jgi:hypothetical protein
MSADHHRVFRTEGGPMRHDRVTVEGSYVMGGSPGHTVSTDVARLRLVCLVRSGDGYVLRGAGRSDTAGGASAHVDIEFGDAGDRRAAAELDTAVRHIQRWCELGTPVALLATEAGVALRAEDGTAVPLPRSAD